MNNFMSVSTISSPEFLNLTPLDINPLISKCEIKVLYVGDNRNRSSISKDVAEQMAKTLRGTPIVGYYKEDKQDFADHGEQVVIDGDGVHFKNLTKPYGFVAPNAKVWFQDFEETNNSNTVIRTYLMTEGFLWTGQYEEAQQIMDDGGKPHSMKLYDDSLSGYWAKKSNSPIEFFIINDAIFENLCILGDDVEPCFEGSSITEPTISKNFSLDSNFTHTLYTMMKELQEILQGGKYTVNEEEKKIEEFQSEDNQAPAVENSATDPVENEDVPAAEFEQKMDNEVQSEVAKSEVSIEGEISDSFAKKEEEEEPKEDKSDKDESEEEKEDSKKEDEDKDKYNLLQTEFEKLQTEFKNLEAEVTELREYKASKENEAKDSLIAEFYMLSDEDKADVINNKSSYSLDEIKSKLAVICYEKKVNYSVKDADENSMAGATLNIQSQVNDKPEWLQAVDRMNGR